MFSIKKTSKSKKMLASQHPGLSLIEVLLAATLITLIVGALVHLGIMSLRTADEGKRRSVATELTKEALETARVQRDSDTGAFFDDLISASGDGYYILNNSTFDFISLAEPTMPDTDFIVSDYTGFYRVCYFELTDANTLALWSKTYWRTASGRWESVSSGTVLTRWR